MIFNLKARLLFPFPAKATILLLLSVVFFFAPADALAQRRFSRTYPAASDVRLELSNRSGFVTVEGWNRPEVSISAYLEAPAATISPQMIAGTIYINVLKDNQGRAEVGNVNFTVRVPYTSNVDIETLIGNLTVSSVRGGSLRARTSLRAPFRRRTVSAISFSMARSTRAVIIGSPRTKAISIFVFHLVRPLGLSLTHLRPAVFRLGRSRIRTWYCSVTDDASRGVLAMAVRLLQ
jgi:hypothetical protein